MLSYLSTKFNFYIRINIIQPTRNFKILLVISCSYYNYSQKIWWGIKFGSVVVYLYDYQNANISYLCIIRMAIPYQTAKFKSANVFAMTQLPNLTPANISSYAVCLLVEVYFLLIYYTYYHPLLCSGIQYQTMLETSSTSSTLSQYSQLSPRTSTKGYHSWPRLGWVSVSTVTWPVMWSSH